MLYEYFLEIKNRSFLIIFSWVVCVFTCYSYKEVLLFLLVKINYNLFCLNSFYFISTSLTDLFNVYIRLSYFISFQVLVINLIYHCLLFISPALFRFEYKSLKQLVFVCCLFYAIGFLVLNSLVVPYIWEFFISFQSQSQGVSVFFEAKITDYLAFYVVVYTVSTIVTQLFVLILLMLNSVPDKKTYIKTTRKVFYSSFVIISTLVTPPDIISQLVISSCFILFYELLAMLVVFKSFVCKLKKIIIIIL